MAVACARYRLGRCGPAKHIGCGQRARKVNAPELVALVRAGAIFHKGKLLERPTDITPDPAPPNDETAGSEVA